MDSGKIWKIILEKNFLDYFFTSDFPLDYRKYVLGSSQDDTDAWILGVYRTQFLHKWAYLTCSAPYETVFDVLKY